MSPKNQPVCVSQLPAFSSDLEHEKRLRDEAENLRLVREEKQRILLEAVVWRRKITEAGDVFACRMAELESVAGWPREDLLKLFVLGHIKAEVLVQRLNDVKTAKEIKPVAEAFLHKQIVEPAIEQSRKFESENRAALEGVNWETMPSRLEVEATSDPLEGVRRMIGLRPGEQIAPGPSGKGKYLGESSAPFTTWGAKYRDIFKG
jgi:hypothetical protein